MNKTHFLILSLLLLLGCSKPKSSQSPTPTATSKVIEGDALQQAIDYTHCKIMALSLSKNPDKTFGAFITNCPCEDTQTLNQERIVYNIAEAPVATGNLSSELSMMIQDTALTNHVANAEYTTNYLSDSIFSKPKKYPKVYDFAQNRLKTDDSTHFINLQSLLRSKIPHILNPPLQAANTTVVNGQPLFDTGWFWALVFALATGGMVLAWWYRFVKPSLQSHNDIKKKLIEVEQASKSLQTQLKAAMNTPKKQEISSGNQQKLEENKESLQTEWAVNIPSSNLPEFLYFSTPNEDGTFSPAYASTTFREGASLFKLRKESAKRGIFEVCNEADTFGRALSKPNFLLPVCEEQNPYFQQAIRIVTEQKGILSLENGLWVVKEKAKIRYQ